MKTHKSLIDKCPYPVHLNIKRGDRFFNSSCGGYFSYHPRCVVVMFNTQETYAGYFGTLAHEIQHALCREQDCFCTVMTTARLRYYREYHAFKAEILACLDYKKALKLTLTHIEYTVTLKGEFTHHAKACRNLMKTALFKKALRRLK